MKNSERKKTNADVAVCRERGREAENNTGQSRHLRFTKSRSAHRRRNTYFWYLSILVILVFCVLDSKFDARPRLQVD